MAYEIDQDRILFRVSFIESDQSLQEIRAWLTRRIVRNLWKGIIQALETQVTLDQPQAAHAKAEMAQMAYQVANEKNLKEGNFSKPFNENVQAYAALGPEPILVAHVHLTVGANRPLSIKFSPKQGHQFEISCKPDVLHGFCMLLQQTVKIAEWDVELNLPGSLGNTLERILN
jgi:hypothetical protein